MFKKNEEQYCPPCSRKNEREYDLISSYLKESPGATVMEVALATGVTLVGVNRFMADSRFHNRDEDPGSRWGD